MHMKKIIMMVVLVVCALMGGKEMSVYAAGMENADVHWSPDGKAFTTNPGDKNTKWYDVRYTVDTGLTGGLRSLKEGEHYYSVEECGTVVIEKWGVVHPKGICIHDSHPEGNYYHGIPFGRECCENPYYSGWLPYCVKCKEKIVHSLFYMSEETAKTITALDMSKDYYYKCPRCDNLEQAVSLTRHMCKEISANRYFVRYHANMGTGYMGKSTHMVNNHTEYEGREVTPQKNLNLNTYKRKGYEFVGWNTKKDGSGISYEDGAEIYNLTTEENASVILYAQWRKRSSILEIDPGGGSYQGKTDIQRIIGEYESEYKINIHELVPAKGNRVQFDTMGGVPIDAMTGKQSFKEWSCSQPFYGELQEGCYRYIGPDGSVDRLTAMYTPEAIILPKAVKEGYSFGGWYADKECTIPIGVAGSSVIPREDMILYAAWVDLQLIAEDNYIANQGKGAVDLSWQQKDNTYKVYEVFQKKEEEDWYKIDSIQQQGTNFYVNRTIGFTGKEGVYTVPYTGFYELTLTGAQGENWETYQGGLGGQTRATLYLKKGEKLSYIIGGQDGYVNGGKGTIYGNGGGYSIVSSERLGTIMIAGGGGGASNWTDGGAGGSLSQKISSQNGQEGASGGGGGCMGGMSGEVIVHHHKETCQHLHIGSPDVYGGCYTNLQACGSTNIGFRETYRSFYYGNKDLDGSLIKCPRCDSFECAGHLDIGGVYRCGRCGYETSSSMDRCPSISRYALSCERDETYICGYREGEVISVKPAYGGSSYINQEICIDYKEALGIQKGNGEFCIVSKQVGLLEDNILKGVTATDYACPDKIAESSVLFTAVTEDSVRVAFKKPKDQGTAYYHQVKSYEKKTMNFVCQSNITKNILVSQVVGYRYRIDANAEGMVSNKDTFYAEKGEAPFLVVDIDESIRYLHIAAEDRAGNIGEAIHIPISTLYTQGLYWPIITEKLFIESGKHVYPSGEQDTYYVKADGDTPVLLTWEGLLCGSARNDYQIEEAHFVVKNTSDASLEGSFIVTVPNREGNLAGSFTYPSRFLQKRLTGPIGIEDAAYTVAQRFQMCRSLLLKQKFTIPTEYNGKTFQVFPKAAIVGNKKAIYSEEARDIQNGLFLIADGEAPQITGVEQLRAIGRVEDLQRKEVTITLTAEDVGSGLAEFSVEIRNLDNGMIKTYHDDSLSGKIQFTVDREDAVFHGKYSVLLQAVDYVGNQSTMQTELLGIGLDAYIERILEPHTPIFKRGESGVLQITTWGYVESVAIHFPESFVQEDASLQRTIVYESLEAVKTEQIPFVVPLDVPDGELMIKVTAYKSGTQLSAQPKLLTIQVKGSVLDELRTRLR